MPTDVIPYTEDGRKSWAENMILKFDPLYVSLGFTKAEKDAFYEDLTMLIYVITASQSVAAESKARTAYKKQMLEGLMGGGNALPLPLNTLPAPPAVVVLPGVLGRIRTFIQRIKLSPGYTEAIGEQLQIVASESEGVNLGDAKPDFTATATVTGIRLDWTKGAFDGVVIESIRGAETTFAFLDKDFKSPFLDVRPNLVAGQPEKRRYRMIYLLDDQIVGVYSDEVVVTTMA